MSTEVLRLAALKYLLAHSPHQQGELLLGYFSEKEQVDICNALDLPKNPFEAVNSGSWLELIHPAWIDQALSQCTPPIDPYLSVLPSEVQESLQNIYNIPKNNALTSLAREFFQEELHRHILGNFSFFSPDTLPPNPLNKLLPLTPLFFEKYCRILGLFDLVVELKQMINPHLLRQMDTYFSDLEKKCIHNFMKKPDLLKFTPLKLNHWKGEIDELYKVLYFRGLNRVAKGLYDAPDELLWYIQRKIPPDQTPFLNTMKTPIHQQRIHNVLISQLIECVDIVNSYLQEGNLL